MHGTMALDYRSGWLYLVKYPVLTHTISPLCAERKVEMNAPKILHICQMINTKDDMATILYGGGPDDHNEDL